MGSDETLNPKPNNFPLNRALGCRNAAFDAPQRYIYIYVFVRRLLLLDRQQAIDESTAHRCRVVRFRKTQFALVSTVVIY